MRNVCAVTSLVGILVGGSINLAAAQSSDATSGNEGAVADTLPGAPDTAQKKKGGGFLGKVKGVAKNKVVQQVAKTAACTMLPGGQVVAGAIDAAANKDAVGAGMSAAAAAVAGAQPSGMDPATMAAYTAHMAVAMQAQMAQSGAAANAGTPPGMPPGAMETPGEGGGQALELSSDLAGDLKKGRTVRDR